MPKISLITIVFTTCLACGGSGSQAPAEAPVETPAPTPAATPAPAREAASPHPDREAYLREHIVALAESQFPDDTGLDWQIYGFVHQESLTFVEVEPNPATVGYPRFKLAVSFEDQAAPEVVASYALIEGTYTLLSSTPGYQDSLPAKLP